jgi:hypothetical protein
LANILLDTEAARVLRCESDDDLMLDLLPLVDAYVATATGRNWENDATIRAEAKSAARMLLALWYENPAMISSGMTTLNWGLHAALAQLETIAIELEKEGIPDEALAIRASMPASGVADVSINVKPVIIFNHEMASGCTADVSIEDAVGATVTSTAALDVTGKILTITPDAALTADSKYTILLDYVADVYGMTLEEEIGFETA